MTIGTDLMQQLMQGELNRAAPETINKVREEVVPALAELIDYGFRARPLHLGTAMVGFIRGIHPQERRQIYRWFSDPSDRVFHILSHATTLTAEDIQGLDGFEAQRLLTLVDRLTEADLSLYPYIGAFSTTSVSEVLWYGRGLAVASWNNRTASIPGGYTFNLLAPPEHSRLWAGVAQLRERSKKRLDDNYNAAMITRALTGKGSDKLYAALKQNQQSLSPDLPDPWMKVVRADLEGVDFGDGWGHAHQDDSVDGVMREVRGMALMDKHEKFMDAFYKQQMEEAQRQEEALEQRFQRAASEAGVDDAFVILSPEQLRAQDERIAAQSREQEAFVTEAISNIHAAEERRESRSRT